MALALQMESDLDMVAVKIGAMARSTPLLLVDATDASARRIADAVVPILAAHTPVDTGELQRSADSRINRDEGGTEIELIETAANPRSGYQYARARAFGHKLRNGEFWTPPEDPDYPQAALEEASPLILAIAREEVAGAMLQIVRIPH